MPSPDPNRQIRIAQRVSGRWDVEVADLNGVKRYTLDEDAGEAAFTRTLLAILDAVRVPT